MITRLGLNGYGIRLAGSFAGKAEGIVQVPDKLCALISITPSISGNQRITPSVEGNPKSDDCN